MDPDKLDMAILAELSTNARISQAELSTRIGLSSTAIARRQRALEDEGYITGYQAVLDLDRFGLNTTVLVRVALDSQSDEALKLFEAAVVKCPSVIRCFLMAGRDDYLLIVLARDIEDFERIHRTKLSRLPRVSRIESNFALRETVNRAVPPTIFEACGPRLHRSHREEPVAQSESRSETIKPRKFSTPKRTLEAEKDQRCEDQSEKYSGLAGR
ncbi:Lrp/AsnC family transcriptional regulator [Bradyrhizobium sp. 76]|nr:Lrp/AsnC family transcriptional regulator [Bradyrhizobium sp. 76]